MVGPGSGRADETAAAVRRLVAAAPVPVVVDGDGLCALGTAEEAAASVGARPRPPSSRRTTASSSAWPGGRPGADRIAAVRDLAARTRAMVLLKGPTTVVADPDGRGAARRPPATPGWPPPAPATCWPA